jgi:glycosyltransferase involved in cell wall biosynthesis
MSLENSREFLFQGNLYFREKDYRKAANSYIKVMLRSPELKRVILDNFEFFRYRYSIKKNHCKLNVIVCGWELSHNAAGRVFTLAQLYERFAKVEIIGSIFNSYGTELWEPLQEVNIPIHYFSVESTSDLKEYISQALVVVANYPCDIIHLSKPRAPNIIIALLYKMIWGARVIIDIDDEELGFVNAEESIDSIFYLKKNGELPIKSRLDGKLWTQLAIGSIKQFDGITVSNPALQERYNGVIIPHARDERVFTPSSQLVHSARKEFNIPVDSQVVLFFGTPRKHKGLIDIAQILANLETKNVIFVVAGDFPEPELKLQLQSINKVNYRFISNQPISQVPKIVALADYCILPLDQNSLAARFQFPAKLTDALAMGVQTWVTPTPAVKHLIDIGICKPLKMDTILGELQKLMISSDKRKKTNIYSISYFKKVLSIKGNSRFLFKKIMEDGLKNKEMSPEQNKLLNAFLDAI